MFKKALSSLTLSAFLFNSVFVRFAFAQTQRVQVAEGEVALDEVIQAVKRDAAQFCEEHDGYLNINPVGNILRIEIDPEDKLVVGVGTMAINFSQKCPGTPIAKLIKGQGTVSVSAIFFGVIDNSGNVEGTVDIGLNIPALISFTTNLSNLPWNAQLSGGKLRGRFTVGLDQFDFESVFSFDLPVDWGEAQLLIPMPKEVIELKNRIAAAKQKIIDEQWHVGGDLGIGVEGIRELSSLRSQVGSVENPLHQAQLYFYIFDGFDLCMEKAGPRSSRYDCVVEGGKTLKAAEGAAQEVTPKEAASSLFITIAQMWDRVRYFSTYAATGVEYDKVENCQQAKQAANQALELDPLDQSAQEMLTHLESAAGCEGMPLFGINREEIEKQRQEAIQKALQDALKASFDEEHQADQEYVDKLDELFEEFDDLSDGEGEENSEEMSEENLDSFVENTEDFIDYLEEESGDLPKEVKEKVLKDLEEVKSIGEELQEEEDPEKKKVLKEKLNEKMREAKQATREALGSEKTEKEYSDALTMAKNLKDGLSGMKTMQDLLGWVKNQKYFKNFDDFRQWVKTGGKGGDILEAFGDYGKLNAFTDAASMLMNFLENKDKYSYDDAVIKSAMDTMALTLLTKIPIFQAAELLTTTPKALGNMLLDLVGARADNDLRIALQVLAETFSPSSAVNETTKLMTNNTYEDILRAVAHAWKKRLKEAKETDNYWEKTKCVAKAGAATMGGVAVGGARGVRDLFYHWGKRIGTNLGWLYGTYL